MIARQTPNDLTTDESVGDSSDPGTTDIPDLRETDESTGQPLLAASTLSLRMAAIRFLLDKRRTSDEIDLILSIILEIVRAQPLSIHEIVAQCQSVSPGLQAPAARVEAAIRVGEACDLLTRAAPPRDGEPERWTYKGTAQADLESAENWTRAVIDDVKNCIIQIARHQGVEVDPEQAELWADILWEAVSLGIRKALRIFSGDVTQRSDASVAPASFDYEAAAGVVRQNVTDEQTAELIVGLVRSAVDPSDVFANDLVSLICSGYVLQAFLSRRDHPQVRALAGSLEESRVIIETPWLLAACGTRKTQHLFREAVRASTAAGVEVIVPQHSIEEAHSVLDRTAQLVAEYEKDLVRGIDVDVLLATVSSSGLVETWLEWVRDEDIIGYSAFHNRARHLLAELTELGINVRKHHNDEGGDAESVQRIAELLARTVETSGSYRASDAIVRDANTLAMAWRTRRKAGFIQGELPSAWIVTADTHMNAAYAEFEDRDAAPIAITPSQWLATVAALSKATDVSTLAEATADLAIRQLTLRVASQWPPRAIMELAKTMRKDMGLAPIDVHLARAEIEELFTSTPDLLEDPARAAASMATVIAGNRAARRDASLRHREAHQAGELRRVQQQKDAESERRRAAEDETERLRKKAADAESEVKETNALGNRKAVTGTVTAIALTAGTLVALLTPLDRVGLGMIASGLIFLALGAQWSTDVNTTWRRLLIPLFSQAGFVIWESLAT